MVEAESEELIRNCRGCLADDGYENPEVNISSKEVMPFVAIGALKVAKAARDDQWIRV